MLWVFGCFLFGTYLGILDLDAVLFSRLWKFSAITLQIVFCLFSLSLLLGLLFDGVPLSPLSCLNFFFHSYLLFFVALIEWFSLPCLWVHWSFLLLHAVYYWTTLLYFSVPLLYSLEVTNYLVLSYNFYLFVEVFTLFRQSLICFIKTLSGVLTCSFFWNLLVMEKLGDLSSLLIVGHCTGGGGL